MVLFKGDVCIGLVLDGIFIGIMLLDKGCWGVWCFAGSLHWTRLGRG